MSDTFTFKAKPERFDDGTWRIKVPVVKHNHVDLDAMRRSKLFGPYANSDMLLGLMRRAVGVALKAGGDEFRSRVYINSEDVPAAVEVDASKFLAVVTVDLSGGFQSARRGVEVG